MSEAQVSPSGAEHTSQRRLDALDRELRRLRRQSLGTLLATAILLGLAAALVVTAARHGMPGFVPEVVESREFVLRDAEGRVRGAWGQDDAGAIRLVLQDRRSATSVKLNLLDDGSAGLTFADSSGQPRLVLALLPDATASLVFADRRGLTRTVLSFHPSGASTLVFADAGGTTRSGIGVDHRGRASLTVQGLTDVEPAPADSAEETSPAPRPERRRRP
jgi:hypothetical protein